MTELAQLTPVFVNSRKNITPQAVEQPLTVALVIISFVAPLRSRIVDPPVFVFSMVRVFVPSFSPFIVTYLAPLKSINPWPLELPETVLLPAGMIVSDVHMPAAPVSAEYPSSQVISPLMVTVMAFPAWDKLFNAANTPLDLVREK